MKKHRRHVAPAGAAREYDAGSSLWQRQRLLIPWRLAAMGAIIVIFAGIVGLDAHRMITRGERSLTWPAADGTVLRSTIVPVSVHDRQGRVTRQHLAAKIECRYQAKGRTLAYSWQESENAYSVLGRYPQGRNVKIYYDPAPESEDAMLHPGVREGDRTLRLWSSLAAILGAVVVAFSLRSLWRSRSERSPMISTQLSG